MSPNPRDLIKHYLTTEKNVASDVQAAREEAISYAAFRLLMHPSSVL